MCTSADGKKKGKKSSPNMSGVPLQSIFLGGEPTEAKCNTTAQLFLVWPRDVGAPI